MLTISPNQLQSQVEQFYEENLKGFFEDRTGHVFGDPTHQTDYVLAFDIRGNRRNWKLNQLIAAAALSWYIPENFRGLFILFLEDIWPKEYKLERELLLSSRKTCFGYLVIQKLFNDHDFFGNILTKENTVTIKRLKFLTYRLPTYQKTDKRFSGWCRGPKDQGSASTKKDPNRFIVDTLNLAKVIEEEISFELLLTSTLREIEDLYQRLETG